MDLSTRAQERIIDGVNYRAWPVPFSVGRPLLVRAAKIAAPAFAAALKSAGEPASTGAQQAAQMSGALEAIGAYLTDTDVVKFADAFGSASSYWGEKKGGEEGWIPLVVANQDMHFAGRYSAFLQWLQFNMEVNGFADFFNTLKDEAAGPPMPASKG